jgi:hypothetical protein
MIRRHSAGGFAAGAGCNCSCPVHCRHGGVGAAPVQNSVPMNSVPGWGVGSQPAGPSAVPSRQAGSSQMPVSRLGSNAGELESEEEDEPKAAGDRIARRKWKEGVGGVGVAATSAQGGGSGVGGGGQDGGPTGGGGAGLETRLRQLYQNIDDDVGIKVRPGALGDAKGCV